MFLVLFCFFLSLLCLECICKKIEGVKVVVCWHLKFESSKKIAGFVRKCRDCSIVMGFLFCFLGFFFLCWGIKMGIKIGSLYHGVNQTHLFFLF